MNDGIGFREKAHHADIHIADIGFPFAPSRQMRQFRVLTCLLILLFGGCMHRPFPVAMRGNIGGRMQMDGNMNVSGQTAVDGTMTMKGDLVTKVKADNTASALSSVVVQGSSDSRTGKIAVIELDGLLVNRNLGGVGSLAENPVALFREKIRHLEQDPTVDAVVLRIDSPGGGVTAAEMIGHDLNRFRQRTGIPVVACLMTHGAGAAYYVATHCDAVVAHGTSVVGGIGVILNLYNMEDALGQYNIVAIPVKSGSQIDAGSPVRTMSEDERATLQHMADSFHQMFVDQVKQARPALTGPTGGTVDDWFDGRVVTGVQAAQAGLVDQTGFIDDAITLAGDLAGITPQACSVIMLRRDNDRAFTPLDITPVRSQIGSLLPIQVPGLDRSELPTFMYLWQIEPKFSHP
ncbi:S49 family peptidase [Crateriforma spongiae]|uniref:S49 family peptidase n=1 Tax=Crateriforma spongiae TaxID=2724528 RepID=UPI001F188786|nr:S49 family peptidase [Crateriforma spongiae]